MEYKAGTDSGVCMLAEEDGVVLSVDARNIRVQYDSGRIQDFEAVSYTHLDVYKRQMLCLKNLKATA